MLKTAGHFKKVVVETGLTVFRNFRGRSTFRREDEVDCFKECIRSLRKVLNSKMNGGNLVRGVNT